MDTAIDGLMICPYNRSHMIEIGKLPNHLVKCRKNNPKLALKIKICPYNRCHHIPIEEMEMHFIHCKDYHTLQALTLKPAPSSALMHRPTQPSTEAMELEHLKYHSHRNKFSTLLPTMIDKDPVKSAVQKQKNLDDLDEWFVE